MPLTPGALAEAVLSLTDPQSPGFRGFPGSTEEAALNWAEVVGGYLSGLTLPPGAGAFALGAVPLAAAAMASALASGSDGLEPLLEAFGASIAAGASAFAATPGVFSLSPLALSLDPLPPAQSFEEDVTSWVAAGRFTPPLGSPTPWS